MAIEPATKEMVQNQRIIKFRVWDKELNKLYLAGGYFWEEQGLGSDNLNDSEYYILQQYTGLKDKNNKEIYEGDLIKGFHDFGPGGMHKKVAQVAWDNEDGYQWRYWDLKSLEIIGNIFEDSELLENNIESQVIIDKNAICRVIAVE